MTDLSRIVNQMRLRGIENETFIPSQILNGALLRGMDVDLRIVCTWNIDLINVELHGTSAHHYNN